MDKYAPKWRHGSEMAMRSWLIEAREHVAKLVRQRARALGYHKKAPYQYAAPGEPGEILSSHPDGTPKWVKPISLPKT